MEVNTAWRCIDSFNNLHKKTNVMHLYQGLKKIASQMLRDIFISKYTKKYGRKSNKQNSPNMSIKKSDVGQKSSMKPSWN